MPHALAVDDDPNFLSALAELIEGQGFTTNTACNLRDARAQVSHKAPDVALIDLYLPDGSGIDLLKDLDPNSSTEVVLMTGHADVESAVQALRLGASDYLTKPLDIGRLKSILANVASVQPGLSSGPPVEENRESGRLGLLLGASDPMLALYEMLTRVAPTDATVFLIGESGTGKDLAAQTVHLLSRRSKGPFLPLNCGAISPTLIESEMFGHERGSFTGAARRHKGYFERAHGGTLFLDEVTEMPFELQVKLLRALEASAVTRVGGSQSVKVDVRIIAATNRRLEDAVKAGKLREDLLYRLNVFPIPLPPLRERGDDVERLADHFLAELNAAEGKSKHLTAAARERLRGHNWPGNLRELKNVVHHAFIVADGNLGLEELGQTAGGKGAAMSLTMAVGTPLVDAERRL